MNNQNKKQLKSKRMSLGRFQEEKKYIIENLAMLLSSGMDIISSLEAIKTEIRSFKMRQVVTQMEEDVDSGTPVWKALEESGLMPAYAISLTKIGEKTGRLPENLKIVALHQQKERGFRAKVFSAMLYPVIVLSLTAFIGISIAWFILPRLSSVFRQLKVELPWITRVLIDTGNFLGNYGIYVVPSVIILLSLAIYFIFVFPKTKFIGQNLLFAFPGTRRIALEVELARAGYLLGMLLESGVPIIDSLESLTDATVFRKYQKVYAGLKESIAEGNSFHRSFDLIPKSGKLIPSSVRHMIAAGEKSGRLPQTFLKIGEIYEEKTDNSTKNFATVIEPILLIIVWVGVVCVALSVILPIYSLIGNLNASRSMPVPAPVVNNASSEAVQEEEPAAVAAETEPDTTRPEEKMILEILETGTGFLNVRSIASTRGKITGKVKPGETYEYRAEQDGWYEIIISPEENGWIKGDYVKKVEENEN